MIMLKKMYVPWAVDKNWGFEIVEGPYTGSVIQLESVEFADENSGELKVDFHVIHMPESLTKESYEKSEFADTMQLIISDILVEAVNYSKEHNDD